MKKENVTIHVVGGYGENVGFNSREWGKTKSTEDQINVIRVSDGYSIVFDDDVFVHLSLSKLASSMLTTFMTNVPDTIFNFRIMYHYDGADDTYFDVNVAKHVLDLDDMMRKIEASKKIQVFEYTRLEGIHEVYRDFRNELEYNSDDDDDINMDDIDFDDEYSDEDDEGNWLLNLDRPKKKEHPSKDYYGRSRVWKNCKQAKKMINRHGVLIASDKDDLRKDEKIIKAFLKDFIPGSSRWKSDFREDVLKRWMSMYAISKKQLKRLEKAHRNRRDCSKVTKMVNIADRLFNVPVDRWYDPTK